MFRSFVKDKIKMALIWCITTAFHVNRFTFQPLHDRKTKTKIKPLFIPSYILKNVMKYSCLCCYNVWNFEYLTKDRYFY